MTELGYKTAKSLKDHVYVHGTRSVPGLVGTSMSRIVEACLLSMEMQLKGKKRRRTASADDTRDADVGSRAEETVTSDTNEEE